jgi:hypothetical protein
MGKKAGHKATKKFAKSGQLKKTIKARHQHREVKKRIERKKNAKNARPGNTAPDDEGGSDISNDEDESTAPASGKGKKTKYAQLCLHFPVVYPCQILRGVCRRFPARWIRQW